jgi:PPOX class probable F420-dependent enzyme
MAMMSRDEALAFLAEGTRTGKLATASSRGAVSVVPVWFLVDGDDLVFTTTQGTLKARNLEQNPRAALAVDVSEFPFEFVTVRGPVSIDRSAPDLVEWATRLAARYVPEGRAEEFGRRNGVAGEWLCRLRAERVVGQHDVAG